MHGIRAAAAVVAAGVLVAAAGCAAGGAAPPGQALVWRPCPAATPDASGATIPRNPAQQCARVTVPVDHGDPDGAGIAIAISRIPAAAPQHRAGALMVHPGDPGLDQPSSRSPSCPIRSATTTT